METFELKKIVKYDSGPAIAGVNFQLGPVVIRGAKIFEKNGKRWLAMPGRISDNGEWGDLVYFLDRFLKDEIEKAVLKVYDEQQAQGRDSSANGEASRKPDNAAAEGSSAAV